MIGNLPSTLCGGFSMRSTDRAGVGCLLIASALGGCHSHGARSGQGSSLAALTPQQWADVIVLTGGRDVPTGRLAPFAAELASASPVARRRALIALGAAGPASQAYASQIVERLNDPDTGVRSEAAFASDASRVRSPALIAAILRMVMTDTSRLVVGRISGLIDHLETRPRVAVNADLSRSLHDALRTAGENRRASIVRLAARSNVSWAVPEFLRLLSDSSEEMRSEAAWGLAAAGDTSSGVAAALRAQTRDTVPWVRDDAARVLEALSTWRESSVPCPHRATEGLIPAALTVDPASRSLKGDGLGAYVEGQDRVSSSQSYAYNLLLSGASNRSVPTIGVRSRMAPSRTRSLTFDLTHPLPASGAQSLGVFSDSSAEFHTFFFLDRNHRVWNTRDIPVGATVTSSRTEFVFNHDGKTFHFHFGPWALGVCNETYETAGRINGLGTTQPDITRISVSDYLVTLPPGSIGRLWEYPAKGVAKDRGLYSYEFVVRIHNLR
jgi:hypothetical protein